MKLFDAVDALQAGHRVRSSGGSTFWLETDKQGRPVLMGQPASHPRPVRHVVLGSEHFNPALDWMIADE
jgi:hypothetical protein